MKRVIMRKLVMGIGDAVMEVDGREIYSARDLARRPVHLDRRLLTTVPTQT